MSDDDIDMNAVVGTHDIARQRPGVATQTGQMLDQIRLRV